MKNLIIIQAFICMFASAQSDTIYFTNKSKLSCEVLMYQKSGIKVLQGNDVIRKIPLIEVDSFYRYKHYVKVPHTKEMLAAIDTVNMSSQMNYMQYCLRKCHKEYKAGVVLEVVGTVCTYVGLETIGHKGAGAFLLIGGVTTLVGLITVVDSHSWLYKAGLGYDGRKGALVYRFK